MFKKPMFYILCSQIADAKNGKQIGPKVIWIGLGVMFYEPAFLGSVIVANEVIEKQNA